MVRYGVENGVVVDGAVVTEGGTHVVRRPIGQHGQVAHGNHDQLLASMAIEVAARANWMKRPHFLTSLLSSQFSGSNCLTSPAKRAE